MILIFSEFEDNSTIQVCRWLLYYKVPFIRLDLEDKYVLRKVEISNKNSERGVCFEISNLENTKIIDIAKVKAVWYRRGSLNLINKTSIEGIEGKLFDDLKWFLIAEMKVLELFYYHLSTKIFHIGSFQSRVVNKLEVLYEASELGLKVPYTVVSSFKDSLKFSKELITKALYEGFQTRYEHKAFTTYTEDVSKTQIPKEFFPTLFQEKIAKEADIRIFFLIDSFYAMAIRSQNHEQTKTDFRKYLVNGANRKFPIEIPRNIAIKLKQLLAFFNLNCASVDMILKPNGDFVFLEINPVGQFGMVSYPCNYFLEKKIASNLIFGMK